MSLSRIKLGYYSQSEIKKLSVIKVTHAGTYDRGVPKLEGLNDPRLGLVDHTIRCPTCFKSNCDQHYGYVELHRPVFRVGILNTVILLLRCFCRECAKPKFSFDETANEIYINETTQRLGPKERLRIISEVCRNKLTCTHCGAPQPLYTRRARTFVDATYRPKELNSEFVKQRGQDYTIFLKKRFFADDAAAVLFGIDKEFAKKHFDMEHLDDLICHSQIVPPPNIRPSNFVGETKVRSENDMTCALQDIVRTNIEFLDYSGNDEKIYENLYDKLQVMVSGLINHAIKRAAAQSGILPLITATSKRKIIDLRTRLNGKKARVRGNLNGKRVDQSARTVISGDSSYDIDVLGVPSVIMNKLTFPEPVTFLNRSKMSKAVILGAYQNGGALAVKPPNNSGSDSVFWLPILDLEGRIELASQLKPGWTVERHLVENDWILFNRQPTLWKASMMAFRCKRVPGFTVRVPLVVTRAFNADFDGDEMNLHSLQGYEAIAEAQELMRVDNQIITPQSGTVVIGLVQDSLVGAWRLTASNCFFSREQVMDLMMAQDYAVPGKGSTEIEYSMSVDGLNSSRQNYDMPMPAILKPIQLWTGKQVASFLLPSRIHIENESVDPLSECHNASGLCIRHGIILTGRLSKTSLGATNRGIIQSVWRLYGPGGAHKFISDAQRMFVKHLAHDGTSQSIMDYLIESEDKIMKTLSRDLGRSDAILNLNLPNEIKEAKSMAILQETLRAVGSGVLKDIQTDCALADCVNSGSKGNVMNIAQICGCVGQQTIYGKRIPIKKTRLGPRTLIYYAPGDMRAESRGFISNSYIRGLSPIETFEHQMAGREGIVATAVNTSETGYNQRRMIKGQESQKLSYDGMVRVSDNKVVQTSYGGDDLDGSKLERIKISWILKDITLPKHIKESPVFLKALKMARAFASYNANIFKTMDPTFPCAVSFRGILDTTTKASLESSKSVLDGHKESLLLEQLLRRIMAIHATHHSSQKSLWNTSIIATILQASEFWYMLTNETIEVIIESYNKAIINPGEGVGALGASSIGEPGMQKTLNTFHYAGIADKNVTITGLPRFKQLINGVDTYEMANITADIKNFENSNSALQISKVMLHDLLDSEINSVWHTYSSAELQYFANFDLQRGPFWTKFGCTEQKQTEKIVLYLNWTSCARKNITIESIAKSLQQSFSYDALVIKWPQWTFEKNSKIEILLAPWITFSRAICESLKSHHQVRGIDYIKNAIVFQETRYNADCKTFSKHVVETEGSNVIDLAACSFIDSQTIRTNNILEVFNVLGITAGIYVLQSELHKVLSFDGSYIDPRHTWLLADTMGRNGSLAAMNRHHMIELGSSLLQEASFERSLEVFEEGAAHGRHDDLIGATERIIVGQPVGIGTGMVECIGTQQNVVVRESVFVPPIALKQEQENNIIVPKLKKFEKTKYDAKIFGQPINEASKDTSDAFFVKCISLFRSNAAEKRIAPNIKFSAKLSESKYRNALASCWSENFTLKESSNLVTEVHWKNEMSNDALDYGITIIKDDQNESYLINEIFNETNNYKRCQIYLKRSMEYKGPFGVESTRVILRQQTKFERGLFSLVLARQWHGNTIAEAEENLLKSEGIFIAILEVTDPSSVLQNRCSNIQLANAIEFRLPF